MSTERLAKCLGELTTLLPDLEDQALETAIKEDIDRILKKIFQHCVSKSKTQFADAYMDKLKESKHGLNLADSAIRALNRDKNLF